MYMNKCECRYEIIANMKILFGKYKGTCFKDIPLNYLNWLHFKEVFLTKNKDIHDYIDYVLEKDYIRVCKLADTDEE